MIQKYLQKGPLLKGPLHRKGGNMDQAVIILVLATFFSGFVDAVVGGGGMISVPTLLALGLPPQNVIPSNKLIGISTAIAGTYKYIRSNIISLKNLVPYMCLSFFAAIAGSFVNIRMSPEFLKLFIFFAVLVLFLYLTFKKNIESAGSPRPKFSSLFFPISIIALGFYDGFFGPGTGTFLIMSILYFQRSSLLEASATGRLLNLTSNLAALGFFMTTGLIMFKFVLPAMLSSFIGGYCGATYSIQYGSKGIRPLLYVVTIALLIKIGKDLFF